MKERVVITGVGLVDTLGTSPMECWDNMITDDYVPPVDFETEVESLLLAQVHHQTETLVVADSSLLLRVYRQT